MKYELSTTPDDHAKAYIQSLYRSLLRVIDIAPKAEVIEARGRVVFKFTGVGSRYRHHVYVEFVPSDDRCVVVARPAYPLYALAVMSPLATLMFPATLARNGAEVVGVLVEKPETAVEIVKRELVKRPLLDPSAVSEGTFEGLLYSTPAGYIAFTRERPEFEFVDIIKEHDESDGVAVTEYFASRFPFAWLRRT